jgi:hypothetical protein
VRRPAVITAIAFALFFVAGSSLFLARGFSATNSERAKVLELLRAQAQGDVDAMLALLPECGAVPACVTTLHNRADAVRRDGELEVLQFRPSVQLAVTDEEGNARVAWRAGDSAPVVQCVRVRRTGALNGARTQLISIGAPVAGDASCG